MWYQTTQYCLAGKVEEAETAREGLLRSQITGLLAAHLHQGLVQVWQSGWKRSKRCPPTRSLKRLARLSFTLDRSLRELIQTHFFHLDLDSHSLIELGILRYSDLNLPQNNSCTARTPETVRSVPCDRLKHLSVVHTIGSVLLAQSAQRSNIIRLLTF